MVIRPLIRFVGYEPYDRSHHRMKVHMMYIIDGIAFATREAALEYKHSK